MVVAEMEVDLPLWDRPALPQPTPHPDQSGALARQVGAVSNEAEQRILVVHLQRMDGMCTGCRAWWARLTPYPCWQVDWATSRQARSLTAALLGGRA
jgi:hypothetical protein